MATEQSQFEETVTQQEHMTDEDANTDELGNQHTLRETISLGLQSMSARGNNIDKMVSGAFCTSMSGQKPGC